MIRLVALSCLLIPAIAAAQVRPQPGLGDPRFQQVDYRPEQVVLVEAALGYQVTIELASDETIESAAVGDGAAWQVSANHAGNRLFVKPLAAGADTNLTVVTNVRNYAFELTTGTAGTSPYAIRFRYASATQAVPAPLKAGAMTGRYKLKGAEALRPSAISDDGTATYIEWPADAALPATYVVDDTGRESLANGNMRGPFYVIDGVAPRLVFRIDRKVARADRLALESDER